MAIADTKPQKEQGIGLGPAPGAVGDAPHDAQAVGHRAVPAREARPAGAYPRRDRAQGSELHRLLQVLARVPRLVHLHRRPQGDPRAGRRRPRAERQDPGPLRDRLRAVHVLRHLRRGLPVRRAVLEPRVRVRGVRHQRHGPRARAAGGVDLHRAAAARLGGGRRGTARGTRGGRRDRAGVRLPRGGGGRLARRDRGGDRPQRRARGAVPRDRARLGRGDVPPGRRRVRRVDADPDLRRCDRDPVPVRADAHEGPDRARHARPRARTGSSAGWSRC